MGVYSRTKLLPIRSSVSSTLSASNTTASNTLWTVTGDIYVSRIYGVVTTALSSNVTAAHWRMNDGTNTPAITLATGTTLSSAGVGALIQKKGLVAAALVLSNSDQVRVSEHATSGLDPDTGFTIVSKNGATNTIEFRYTTTNTPASGVIQFFLEWVPVSASGSIA